MKLQERERKGSGRGMLPQFEALLKCLVSASRDAGTAAAKDGQDERSELASPYTKCRHPAGLSAAFRRYRAPAGFRQTNSGNPHSGCTGARSGYGILASMVT